MNQMAISFETRVRIARSLGADAGARALEANDPTFEPRAIAFLRDFARRMPAGSEIPGEELTRAMKAAGILPRKDDRAFGPIFKKAAGDRMRLLRVVGQVARVRGHGARDGKLYAAGEGV